MNKLTLLESNVAEYNPDVIGISYNRIMGYREGHTRTVRTRRLYMLQTRQNERLQH